MNAPHCRLETAGASFIREGGAPSFHPELPIPPSGGNARRGADAKKEAVGQLTGNRRLPAPEHYPCRVAYEPATILVSSSRMLPSDR